jgi:hypothetical protein
MIVDALLYILGFILPALDLYGALVDEDPHSSARSTIELLRHFVVVVAFRAITTPLDFFLGSFFIYDFAKLVCIILLISGKQYAGSRWVYREGILRLATQFPEVVEFAERAHEGTVFRNAQYLAGGLVKKFKNEYSEILKEIDD